MAANLYERSITPTGKGSSSSQFLADTSLVMDATIIMSQKNTNNVTVEIFGLETVTASWPPGATVHLRNADLSKIKVTVQAEHCVLVVGQAP